MTMSLVACLRRERPSDRKFRDFDPVISDSLSYINIFEDDSTSIKINLSDLNKFSNILDPKEFVDSVSYISLETTVESLISGIEKLDIYNNRVYILDNLNKSLLVFADDGQFIRKVGKHGKGPQEFINPIDFVIDQQQNRLLILDDKSSKILVFSLEGEFIEENAVGFRFNDFLIGSDSTYIVNTDVRPNHHNEYLENYKLIIVDKKWDVLSRGNLYDSYHCSDIAFSRDALYRSGEKSILYNPMFSYSIFELKDKDFFAKYTFGVEGMKLPENFECGLDFYDFSGTYDGRNSSYAYINKPIVESPDWLITTFRHKAQNAFMFYNRNTGKTYWGVFYNDDSDSFIFLAPMMGITDKGQFYSYVSALELKQRYLNYVKNTGRNSGELEKIKEGDNPVIVFYKLKD